MEKVDFVQLFANTDKAYRHARHLLDAERCTAAGIAIHLREADAGKVQAVPECFGDVHRFLTDHSIGNEQNFVRMNRVAGLFEFLHQLFVNLQTACRIVNHEVKTVVLSILVAVLDDFDRIALAFVINRNADGLAEHLQLLDSGRTVNVSGNEERLPLLLAAHPECDLACESRLTRTLQTNHHDAHRRRCGKIDFLGFATHDGHKLVVDNLHNLLTRGHGIEHFGAHGLFLDRLHKVAGHVEVHVGSEERATHLTQRFRHIFFGKFALPTQVLESIF